MEDEIVNLLCIRDSDESNDYVSDREINVITIDVGGSWSTSSHFDEDLRAGDEDALEYEKDILSEVAHLPADNVVRLAVEAFFARARQT